MNTLLIILVVILALATVFTLVRGIVVFLQSARQEVDNPGGSGPTANQLMQNKLMFRRILFQGATILVVAILLFAARK